jgi:hypothetical protein
MAGLKTKSPESIGALFLSPKTGIPFTLFGTKLKVGNKSILRPQKEKQMKNTHTVFPLVMISAMFISIFLNGCKKENNLADIRVISGTGDIASEVNEFRQVLGSQLNTNTGAVGGRREINWDGVAPDLLDKPLAENFFNTPGDNVPPARQKGLLYSAGINNFQVSKDGFRSTNASTANEFSAFSGSQVFANVGSNLWDIGFQVPGESIPATIKGFGLVFSDVDIPNSTFLEFFNGAKSLGKYFAPVHDGSSNLSFLGIYFNNEKVTRIRIGHDGTLSEGGKDITSGGSKDFVVFDDFLFDEPVIR